jgi:hypothetical protein
MRFWIFLGGFGLTLFVFGCSAPERRQNLASEQVFGSRLVWSSETGYQRLDTRAAFQDFMLLHESFVHASQENLGKPSDEAAIREAILPLVCLPRPILGSQPPLIHIRWLSPRVVVAKVSTFHSSTYYCVVQSEQGKWEGSTSLPKWYIVPLKDLHPALPFSRS